MDAYRRYQSAGQSLRVRLRKGRTLIATIATALVAIPMFSTGSGNVNDATAPAVLRVGSVAPRKAELRFALFNRPFLVNIRHPNRPAKRQIEIGCECVFTSLTGETDFAVALMRRSVSVNFAA